MLVINPIRFSKTLQGLRKRPNFTSINNTLLFSICDNLRCARQVRQKNIWFFDSFCKKNSSFLQCGFNPLLFSYLLQWAKATLEENAKIVKNHFFLKKD